LRILVSFEPEQLFVALPFAREARRRIEIRPQFMRNSLPGKLNEIGYAYIQLEQAKTNYQRYRNVVFSYGFRGILRYFSRFLSFADERIEVGKQHSSSRQLQLRKLC